MFVLTVIALVMQQVAPYLFFFRRWNIPAHMGLGFCVTAFIVPGLFTDVWSVVSDKTNLYFFYINFFGALCLISGMAIGYFSPCYRWIHQKIGYLSSADLNIDKIEKRVIIFALIGVVGISLAYMIMGFVPMFAADPLSAKQFKGEYYEAYHRAASLFRFSFSVIVATLPIVLTFWWVKKKRSLLFLALLMIFLLLISLARGSSLIGLITFAGFVAARRRSTALFYIFCLGIIFPIGSAGYYILGVLTGIEKFSSVYALDSVASVIASGSPDIADQLIFLEGFLRSTPFTYGRTFFGGLIPSNYMWNPSVWTLTYDNVGADITNVVSGGLRMTVAEWGFASFGWIGVVMVPLISGFFSGTFLRVLSRFNFKGPLIPSALILMLYITLGGQIVSFYTLSIHGVPTIMCTLFICFGFKGVIAMFTSRRLLN